MYANINKTRMCGTSTRIYQESIRVISALTSE